MKLWVAAPLFAKDTPLSNTQRKPVSYREHLAHAVKTSFTVKTFTTDNGHYENVENLQFFVNNQMYDITCNHRLVA